MKDDTRSADAARLAALASELERAKNGSRELDARIWLATTPRARRHKWSYTHKASGQVCNVDETRDPSGKLIVVPAYSSDLQAAQHLVPAGWNWRVGFEIDGYFAELAEPEMTDYGLGVGVRAQVYQAPTPALALCVAALKARAVASPQGEPREARESSRSSSEDR